MLDSDLEGLLPSKVYNRSRHGVMRLPERCELLVGVGV